MDEAKLPQGWERDRKVPSLKLHLPNISVDNGGDEKAKKQGAHALDQQHVASGSLDQAMDEDDDSSDFEEFPIVRPTRITAKEASDQSSSSALPSDKSSSKANDVVPCSSSSTESPADKTKEVKEDASGENKRAGDSNAIKQPEIQKARINSNPSVGTQQENFKAAKPIKSNTFSKSKMGAAEETLQAKRSKSGKLHIPKASERKMFVPKRKEVSEDDDFDDSVFLTKEEREKLEREKLQAKKEIKPGRRQLRPSRKQKRFTQKKPASNLKEPSKADSSGGIARLDERRVATKDDSDEKRQQEDPKESGNKNQDNVGPILDVFGDYEDNNNNNNMAVQTTDAKEENEDDEGGGGEEQDDHDEDEDVENEWKAVTAMRNKQIEQEAEDAKQVGIIKKATESKAIAYVEALLELKLLDLTEFKDKIKVESTDGVSGLRKMSFLIFGKPKLRTKKLIDERTKVFLLAKAKLDHQSAPQTRILQTIYRLGTGDNRACPKFGSHWSALGFQGNDPGTDLRGAGLYGLLQLLYLLENEPVLCHRILLLSRSEDQKFPFAVVSFNWTGIVLQVMREGKIFPLINNRGSVFEMLNELHTAIYYSFYLKWKNDMCTIVNFGEVSKQLHKDVRKNPSVCLKQLQRYKEEMKARSEQNSEKIEFGNSS